jgi:hypothetical protein
VLKTYLVSFLLIFSFLSAQESESFAFLGLGVSTQSVDMDKGDQGETTLSLKYGKQTLDWRTFFAYEFKGSNYQQFSVEVDKILLDELFGTPKVRPYLGLSAGILKYKDDTLEDTDGFYYGGNTGFIFYLTDNIDLDLNYHYDVVQEIETVDSINGVSLSLHYFY